MTFAHDGAVIFNLLVAGVLFAHRQRLAVDSPNLTVPHPTLRLLDVPGGDA